MNTANIPALASLGLAAFRAPHERAADGLRWAADKYPEDADVYAEIAAKRDAIARVDGSAEPIGNAERKRALSLYLAATGR